MKYIEKITKPIANMFRDETSSLENQISRLIALGYPERLNIPPSEYLSTLLDATNTTPNKHTILVEPRLPMNIQLELTQVQLTDPAHAHAFMQEADQTNPYTIQLSTIYRLQHGSESVSQILQTLHPELRPINLFEGLALLRETQLQYDTVFPGTELENNLIPIIQSLGTSQQPLYRLNLMDSNSPTLFETQALPTVLNS